MENEKGFEEKIKGQKPVANNMIKNHVLGAMGIGLIPFPLIDFLALTGFQLNMLRKLAHLYEFEFSKELGRSFISSLVGSVTPILLFKPAASLVKIVPVVGQSLGMVAMPGVAGASTYALGHVFVKHFESGGTFLGFDSERMRQYYAEKFEEGKKVVSDLKKEPAGAGKKA